MMDNKLKKRLFALALTACGGGLLGAYLKSDILSVIVIAGMLCLFFGGNLNGSCEGE